MKNIKLLKRDNYELNHSRYVDDFGIERDSFFFTEVDEKGWRTHRPFFAPLKVTNYHKNEPVPTTTNYSDEEYEEMLSNQISRLSPHGDLH